jgi:DNA polymerase III subunit epsilon
VRQIVLDTETTGLEVDKDHRIIEIGCIELLNRRVTGRTFHRYLNPERAIDVGAQQVHGLSLERLAPEPKFVEIAPQFLEFVQGAELIIHNAPFDVAFLNAELRRLGDQAADIAAICSVLDTLVLARNMHPGQRNNLDALCKRYGVDNSQRDLHGALLDARILADVYLAMTGGQAKLTWGADMDGGREQSALHAGRATAPGAAQGQRIPVVAASAEELAAHSEALLRIDKASDGKTVWRRP